MSAKPKQLPKQVPVKIPANLPDPGHSPRRPLADIMAALADLHECFPGYDLTLILVATEPGKRNVVIPVYPAVKSPASK